MGVVVDDDSFDWALKIEINLVYGFFVADDYIFNFVSLKVFIVEYRIEFLFSDDVLASEVAALLNGKCLHAKIIVILDQRL